VKRLWRATINSWNGLVAATQSEQAFREELAALVFGVPLAFFLTADAGWRFALIGSLVFLLIVELLNTALEKLSDRVTRAHDPDIKHVKDMASAAILLAVVIAGALWLWILFKFFWR
jgi:diacylglycerol kinase (ATP)